MTKVLCVLVVLCAIASADTPTIEQQLAEAEKAYADRHFPEAVEKFQPLLQHFEHSKDQQKLADICFKLGRSNRKLGNYNEAYKLLDRALKLHTQIGDQQAIAFDITETAIAHQRQGEYDVAIELGEKALAIHEKLGNLLGIARTRDVLGTTYYRRSEFDKAIETYAPAIPAATESGDKEMLSIVYVNFGQVYMGLGDYDRALEYYEKSMSLAEEIGDLNLQTTSIANAALIHQNQGDLKRALTETEQALSMYRQLGNRALEAVGYLDFGQLHYQMGNYAPAVENWERCLKMAREIDDKGLAASALDNMGILESDLGNYESALHYSEQALELAREIGEQYIIANGLQTLGRIHSSMGNDRAAIDYFRKAIQIDRETKMKHRFQMHLSQIGDLYAKLGDLNQALNSYNEAISVQQSMGLKNELGFTYTKIAALDRKKRNFVQAETMMAKGLDLVREGEIPEYLWPALYNKALLNRDMGKSAESLQSLKEAVDVIERIRLSVELPELKSSYLESRFDVYEELIQQLVDANNIPEAFEYVQRSKARTFLDLLSEKRIDPQADLDQAQYNQKRKWLAKVVTCNRKIKEEQEKDKPDTALIRRLEKMRIEADQAYVKMQAEIRRQNPRFSELQNPQLLNLQEAQALLDKQTVLMDYFVAKNQSFVFAATLTQCKMFRIPGEKILRPEVDELLDALKKPEAIWQSTEEAHSSYVKVANLLYSQVLEPAARVWKGKSRIIVAADGPLNYVPFEALLTSSVESSSIDFSALPYFALQHEIQYVPSVSAFDAITRHTDPARKPAKELIAFADPILAKNSSPKVTGDETLRNWTTSLSELPYARVEVQKISELFPREQFSILIGKDATESNAKTLQLQDFRTVHFASHGLIDEERPQLSSIVLNPGKAEEDGYLTMREVFDLKLNADLVVLSACKTGLGRNTRGEGLTGLARAFFCAGASSVLVSLWNVNDRSTSDLMTAFYAARSRQSMSKTAALKEARLKMIQSKKYSHPYYWSPFILIGAR